jgi:cellulose synthase/poly-beta-1,6-N-acetylglucosamine synthase-like glycosyltransferase
MILAISNILLSILAVLVLVPVAVFCVECFAAVLARVIACRERPPRRSHFVLRLFRRIRNAAEGVPCSATMQTEQPRAAVLIPAHNEQLLIGQTLGAILPAGSENGRVLVVADNCDDQTAELARGAGAEVVVRFDAAHRGKGFAMQSGLEALRSNPPDVVVVLDADCLTDPESLDLMARLAHSTQRPVQSLNLTDRNPADGPVQTVSILGNRFINMIRPLGQSALGIPCRLMGTGMAIPWALAENVETHGGSLVEDMQLGIDMALRGHLPLFCSNARVTSGLPSADRAFVSQRTRWEHGHLVTAARQIPLLVGASIRRRSWPLLGIALDLSVPPLTLLVALWLCAAILALAGWWLGASALPAALLAAGGAALIAALGLGWAVFCRKQVPLRTFAAVPFYMLRKLPIYAGLVFDRQHTWVRTERSSVPKQ